MAWKSASKVEEEQDEALADLDYAYEKAFNTADWVRQCPLCEGGWRYFQRPHPLVPTWMVWVATECSCFMEHLKSLRSVRIAKERYRAVTNNEPPEPDRAKLELW